MKKLLGLDQIYEQLKQMNLVGPNFLDMPFCYIRKYAKTLSLVSSRNQLDVILQKLRSENKSSNQSLKAIIFLNFLLNQFAASSKLQINQLITKQINNIITLERLRYEKIQKTRSNNRESSIDKTVNWFKQRLSKSKEKTEIKTKKNMSFQTKQSSHNRTSTQITHTSEAQNQPPTQGKQQLLISKIILPYASYVLKLASSQIDEVKCNIKSQLKNVQIWKLINLIKSLLKMSQVFPTMLRYYSKQYYNLVFAVVRTMDFQLKNLYPIIQKSVMIKINLIEKSTIQIYAKAQNQKKKVELLEEIIYKYELGQFRQILSQISSLNESIINIYLGKYTYVGITSIGLKQPTLFADQSKSQLIYDIIKQVQKTKSVAKRLFESKQKNKLSTPTDAVRMRIKSQMTQGLNSKKLKILQGIKRQIETIQTKQAKQEKQAKQTKQKPVQTMQGQKISYKQPSSSTFRKMRLNMTNQSNHMQESNTRRLRL